MAILRPVLTSMYLLILVSPLLSFSSTKKTKSDLKLIREPQEDLKNFEQVKPTLKPIRNRNTDSIRIINNSEGKNKPNNGAGPVLSSTSPTLSTRYDKRTRGIDSNPSQPPTPTSQLSNKSRRGKGLQEKPRPRPRPNTGRPRLRRHRRRREDSEGTPTQQSTSKRPQSRHSSRRPYTSTTQCSPASNGESNSGGTGGPTPSTSSTAGSSTEKSSQSSHSSHTPQTSTTQRSPISNRRSKSSGSARTTRSPRGNRGNSSHNGSNSDSNNNRGRNNELTPNEIQNRLKNLTKQKVNQRNAREVAINLNNVVKRSRPSDLSKNDTDVAANIMSSIISVKERLNETADVLVDLIDMLMEINKTILAESQTASKKIIKALDTLVQHIPFDENTNSKQINKTNIIIQAHQVQPQNFQGITFGVKTNQRSRRNVLRDPVSVENMKDNFMKLPREVLRNTNMSSVRVGFIYYANNKLFQTEATNEELVNTSQTVLASTVYSGRTISNLTEPVRISFPLQSGQSEVDRNKTSKCVFWIESARQWSHSGCSLCTKQSNKDNVECCCNHLTSFAVLFTPKKGKSSANSGAHATVLSLISYVGCVISIVGVVLTFLTYSIFRHLRKTNQQPILMNLCVAIALLLIVFVAGINVTDNRLTCQVVAVLLHYLTLVTVLWMGIEAYNLYLQIVKVMGTYQRKFMLKAAVIGWGVPFLIVMATLAAAIIQYKQKEGNISFYYGSDQVCTLHHQLYWVISWFTPVLVILFFNLVAFFFIIYKLNSRHSMLPVEPKSKYIKNCWTSLAIMVLLGVTWLFGALAISDARIVFEYLFCIFNSLQGFFIFFFHCVRIKEVRNQWSFFVSGLGFSHGDSKHSQQNMDSSRKISGSIHMQKMGNVNQGNNSEDKQAQRKVTVVTMVGNDVNESCS